MSSEKQVVITAPKFESMKVHIVGTAPLVMHKFWKKAEIMATQAEGKSGKRNGKKAARDFESDYLKSIHRAAEGWYGIPASAFRAAMISACRLVGFKMTLAKLSVWVTQDGFDADGYPLVKLTKGEPRRHDAYVRNQTGVVDIRSRPMFHEWAATVTITYDADQFNSSDVVNLLSRAGGQVGLLEGRPDSKESAGMGWGTFRILTEDEVRNVA